MRPRINRSTVLVAKSSESSALIDAKVRHTKENKPYVYIFEKKRYIDPSEEEFYIESGFVVYRDK